MRIRRVALLAMLTVGLVLSTTASVGAEAASKVPPGFKTVKIKKAGFSIALPKDWQVLDVTRRDAANLLASIKKKFPGLASQLPAGVSDLIAQNIVLLAVSDKADGTNVNVLLIPGVTDPPTIDDIATPVRSIASGEPKFSEVTVAGEDAVKAEYDLNRSGLRPHLIQYAVTGNRGGLAFTFTASQSNPNTEEFAKMVKSIKLLKR